MSDTDTAMIDAWNAYTLSKGQRDVMHESFEAGWNARAALKSPPAPAAPTAPPAQPIHAVNNSPVAPGERATMVRVTATFKPDLTVGKVYDVRGWFEGYPCVRNDNGIGCYLASTKWEPVPAPTQAAPAPYVPKVGDVVEWCGRDDSVRVVTVADPLTWVTVTGKDRTPWSPLWSFSAMWREWVRFVRKATPVECKAAGLPVATGERAAVALAVVSAYEDDPRRLFGADQPRDAAQYASGCGPEFIVRPLVYGDAPTQAAPANVEGMRGALTFDALRAVNVPRVAAFGQTLASWSAMEWACAAAGEMGELCNVLKKRSRKEDPKRPGCDITGKPIPTVRDVADEIADVVIYLDLLAAREGIDVAEAVARKWNETSEKMGHAPRLTVPGKVTQ